MSTMDLDLIGLRLLKQEKYFGEWDTTQDRIMRYV